MTTDYDEPSEKSQIDADIPLGDGSLNSWTISQPQGEKLTSTLLPYLLGTKVKKDNIPGDSSSEYSPPSLQPLVGFTRYGVLGALGSNVLLLVLHFYRDGTASAFRLVAVALLKRGAPGESITALLSNQRDSELDSRRNECLLPVYIVIIILYWSFAVSLFGRAHWKKYYPRVFLAVVLGTVIATFKVQDIAVLLVLFIPTMLTTCILGCSLAEIC